VTRLLLLGREEILVHAAISGYDGVLLPPLRSAVCLWTGESQRTPNAKPRGERGVRKIYRSRKEVAYGPSGTVADPGFTQETPDQTSHRHRCLGDPKGAGRATARLLSTDTSMFPRMRPPAFHRAIRIQSQGPCLSYETRQCRRALPVRIRAYAHPGE